jgi:hypothetical protein
MPKPKRAIVRLHPMPEITPRPKKTIVFTERPPGSKRLYLRKVRGQKWQARPWVGGHHVNLGLFNTEAEAQQAVSDWVRSGAKPDRLLLKYVYRKNGPNGEQCYYSRYVSQGLKFSIVCKGPFATQEEAHREIIKLIRRLRPRRLHAFAIHYGPSIWRLQQEGSTPNRISQQIGLSRAILGELLKKFGDRLLHGHISTTSRRAI